MAKLTFKPKQSAKKLLSALPTRARDVISKRFGLDGSEKHTLEAIGQIYGITRERVRQIENFALASLRKSSAYSESAPIFDELAKHIADQGVVVREESFLNDLAKNDDPIKNHLAFFLHLGDDFTRLKEDDEFHHRWTTDTHHAEKVSESLRQMYKTLSLDDVIGEKELLNSYIAQAKEILDSNLSPDNIARYLSISKQIGVNPLGGWGVAHSPNIKIRGMRDLAYLVLRESGSPMHFREVAKAIKKSFGRDAHVATCHNELIKDERFVLVGRGLYALTTWGYTKGTVRDIIAEILRKGGPLTKSEIVSRVLKERYVKENTIGVNLQNSKQFKRDDEGRYIVI